MAIKRCILLVVIISIAFGFLSMVSAQDEAPLEVDYPEVPHEEAITPEDTGTTLPRYIEYVFYFLVWGSGILALLALIYGGFKYVTSFGNPDKLKDAKDKIISALLGLAIVLGSYIILWQINPQLLTFELPRLKPFINTMAPGVWACKTMNFPTDPVDIWVLEQIYNTNTLISPMLLSDEVRASVERLTAQFAAQGLLITSISDENNIAIRKAIKEKIDELLERINKVCYQVQNAGAVAADFNNRIENIWLIPEIDRSVSGEMQSINHYGVAVFDGDDFTGLGNIFFQHLLFEAPWNRAPIHILNYPTANTRIEISSIKPFKRYLPVWIISGNIPDPPLWKVRLYQGVDFNKAGPVDASLNPLPPFMDIGSNMLLYWFAYNDADTQELIAHPILADDPDIYALPAEGIAISPASMELEGEAMVILYKDSLTGAEGGGYKTTRTTVGDQKGYYFQIFQESDYNLNDEFNITRLEPCRSGEPATEQCEEERYGGFRVYTYTYPCCRKADSDGILILAGVKTY